MAFAGFRVSNLGLSIAISDSLGRIARETFAGPYPAILHHYTDAKAVESIIRSRSLWATCIEDQLDKSEVLHVCDLVLDSATRLFRTKIAGFAGDVLERLSHFMEERRHWIFIACFCDDSDSELHWKQYGSYCLTFNTPRPGTPALCLSDLQADCWYQRVIYDESLQRKTITEALRGIATALSQYTSGINEGPWGKMIVDMCAGHAAQLLLGIAVGFKRSVFERENEWRIVCAPRLGANTTAPKLLDENFSVNVKSTGGRRHVHLHVPSEGRMFQRISIPSVPFIRYSSGPYGTKTEEIERINQSLRENGRTDLCIA